MKLFFLLIPLCCCQIPGFIFSFNCNDFHEFSQDLQASTKSPFSSKFQKIRGGALKGGQDRPNNTEKVHDILTPFFKRMNFENILTPRWPSSVMSTKERIKIKDQAPMLSHNISVSSSEEQTPTDSSQKERESLQAHLKHFIVRFFECLLLAVPIESFLWNLGLSSDRSFINSISQWVAGGIYLTLIIAGLGTVGFDTKPILAGLGLTTFTIGFALKELVSNILAGALLVLQRPFRVGWTIKVNAFRGKVLAIDTRYVRLLSDEGQIILIPSYTVFSSPIIVEDIPGINMKLKRRENSSQ